VAYHSGEPTNGGDLCLEVRVPDPSESSVFVTLTRSEAAGLVGKLARLLAKEQPELEA
jgi:hypothetical protein